MGKQQEVPEEYRGKRRVSLVVEVACQSQNAYGFGKTENVSETGLLVNSPQTLPPNSELDVRFVLLVHRQAIVVESKGKVTWVRPGVSMGIQFVDLKEEYREAIAQVC